MAEGRASLWPAVARRLAFVFGEIVTPISDPADADDLAAFTQRVREAIEIEVARARAITDTG